MKTEYCEKCKRHTECKHPFLEGAGNNTDVMIIGDKPSFDEDQRAQLLCSSTGKWLCRELINVGIDLAECYITKAVKCFSGRAVTKTAVKGCRELLTEEVRRVKPKYILALGKDALHVILNKTNMSKHRGQAFTWEGAKVVFAYHPGQVIRQPGLAHTFRSDLHYFKRMTSGEWTPPKDFKWEVITSYSRLHEMIRYIKEAKEVAYDIETTCLKDTVTGKILMIGFAIKGRCYIVPWEVKWRDKSIKLAHVRQAVTQVMESKALKIAQNAKFDNRWLRSRGVKPRVDFDTYLAAYVLNTSLPHGLKYMAKTYCGADDYDKSIEFKEGLTHKEFMDMAEYCALDCYYTLKLYFILNAELEKDNGLRKVFKYIVMPGERVLQKIEERGVYVNQRKLLATYQLYKDKLEQADKKIDQLLPPKWKGKINLGSPKQLAELLFTDLRLPVISKTPGGAPSTGKSTLLRLVDKHPLPKLILERRKYAKAINGFLDPWVDYLKADGRLHTTYNIAKTSTGRLSAEDPNLQQVPRDKNVRQLISAPSGRLFIEADYSQVELRAAAFIAGANSMKRIYRNGGDIHRRTASQVAGVPEDKITKKQRTSAKAVNFGYLYGMWWKSFKAYAFDSYGVVVTDIEAQLSRRRYFETYPELLPWHDRQRQEVRQFKCVRTPTGRIRHLPDIDSPDNDISGGAERQAINTPVQSFASDMTLLAMILIDKYIEKYQFDAYLVGQVHDAIMIESSRKDAVAVGKLVKVVMESIPQILLKYFGIQFDLPLVADVEIGEGWGIGTDLKEILQKGLTS